MANNPGEGKVTNPKVSIAATITKVMTMADKSLRLQVDTQEIDPETKSVVFEMHDKPGFFFFDEAAIRKIDTSKLPEINLDEGERSPSQRLRAVMFVYHEQKGIKEPFELFYRRSVEKIINDVKEKLV